MSRTLDDRVIWSIAGDIPITFFWRDSLVKLSLLASADVIYCFACVYAYQVHFVKV